MRAIDADALMDIFANGLALLGERFGIDSAPCGAIAGVMKVIERQPTIEERKTTIEFPHVFIAEGYDSIKSEDGRTGFGVYDPENKQIFIAGAVPDEVFIKVLLHELMHWVQDISGYAFNEDEANAFAENIYNTMESYIVTSRWIPCDEKLPEKPGIYMVTDTNGNVVRFMFNKNESSREYWLRCAKAWRTLPEPYKERREG